MCSVSNQAAADAEDRPAVRDVVEGRRHLGGERRLAERVRPDHQPDPDLLGRLRPGGERQPALEDRPVVDCRRSDRGGPTSTACRSPSRSARSPASSRIGQSVYWFQHSAPSLTAGNSGSIERYLRDRALPDRAATMSRAQSLRFLDLSAASRGGSVARIRRDAGSMVGAARSPSASCTVDGAADVGDDRGQQIAASAPMVTDRACKLVRDIDLLDGSPSRTSTRVRKAAARSRPSGARHERRSNCQLDGSPFSAASPGRRC